MILPVEFEEKEIDMDKIRELLEVIEIERKNRSSSEPE